MIHILGVGSIGRLIGHTLRCGNKEVTFIVRPASLTKYTSHWRLSVLNPDHAKSQVSTGYAFELAKTAETLQTLLVCTKAYDAVEAVRSVSHRIDPDTQIVLLNNGIGVEEDVHAIFSKTSKMPIVSCGLLSHGAYSVDANTICHAGQGAFFLASKQPERGMMNIAALCESLAPLGAKPISMQEFRQQQLTKLLVNACINPVTAINNQKNGSLSQYPGLINSLVAESLPILRAAYPEIVLSAPTLRSTIETVIEKTKGNSSSMLQDVRGRRQTEIDYINGAIVRLGHLHALQAPINAELTRIVKNLSSDRGTAQRDLNTLIATTCSPVTR